jgi:hypothetical protein
MQYNPPAYYRPYESDDEDDDDKTEVTSDSSISENSQFDRFEDPRYAIIKAAGPSFKTLSKQELYNSSGIPSSVYEPATQSTFTNSILYLPPPKTTQTSLFSIKSSNRDQNIYPASARFSLKLPRVYRNVSQVRCVQVSFPYYQAAIANPSSLNSTLVNYLYSNLSPSTFSSSISCLNTTSATYSFMYREIGRTNPVPDAFGAPLYLVTSLRDGGYNPDTIVAELNKQMNSTPYFNIIDYATHYATYRANLTLTHLFNYPNDYTYDPVTNRFTQITQPSDVQALFIPTTYTQAVTSPTDREIFVAYYYPVLKIAVLDPSDQYQLDLNGYTYETTYKRVVNFFEGLDSTFYYDLCSSNVSFLTKLRRQYTFEYAPILKYNWYYDVNLNRIGVTFNELCTSITSDIVFQNANCIAAAQQQNCLTATDFLALQTTVAADGAVVEDFYNVISKALASCMGIPYGVYSQNDIANPSTVISTSNVVLPPDQLVSSSSNLLAIALGGPPNKPVVPPSPYYPPNPPAFTFGPIMFADASSLTATLVNQTAGSASASAGYTPAYSTALGCLNTESYINRYVGAGLLNGYGGVNFSDTSIRTCITEGVITNFSTLYGQYLKYYSSYTGNLKTISSILGCSNTDLNYYINRKYGTVFPPELLNIGALNIKGGYLNTIDTSIDVEWFTNNRLCKPSSPFDDFTSEEQKLGCGAINTYIYNTFYGPLPPKYVQNLLTFKIGMIGPKYTNVSSLLRHYNFIMPFSPLINQNTYLQINTQQSLTFNGMDVAGDENVTLTNETTGQTKLVLGKILMTGLTFLGVSQTIIQQPAVFTPPIGKLDKLEFNMLLDDGTPLADVFPFNYDATNWDAVFQIDEEVATIDRADLTEKPTVPLAYGKLPY